MKDNHNNKNYTFQQYLKISASFASAKFSLMLIRHPIHVVQSIKQANPRVSNIDIIKDIYDQRGIRGFYKSTMVSVVKILIAESYRGPLMIGVHTYIENNVTKNNTHNTLISMPIISVIYSALICPILRLSTHQLTSSNHQLKSKNIIYSYMLTSPIKQSYRGYSALLLQTTNLWGSFFLIDDLSKSLIKKYSGEVSYPKLAAASVIGGLVQTSLNIIPDTIRVQMQKESASNKNIINVSKEFVKTHGVKGLFSGLPHKITASIIGYGYKSALRHYWNNKTENEPNISENHTDKFFEENRWQSRVKS